MRKIRKADVIGHRKIPKFKYYHLTDALIGKQAILQPRITERGYRDIRDFLIEDNHTARVSFSTSLNGALLGCSYDDGDGWDVSLFSVYATNKLNGLKRLNQHPPPGYSHDFVFEKCLNRLPAKIRKLYDANYEFDCENKINPLLFKYCVPDAHLTKEIWALKPTPVVLVGSLEFDEYGTWTFTPRKS